MAADVQKKAPLRLVLMTASHSSAESLRRERSRVMPVLLTSRKGEILGLQWKDIDWSGESLHVRRSLEPSKAGPCFKDPNTSAARRTVDLSSMALVVLRDH
jgi:integrase